MKKAIVAALVAVYLLSLIGGSIYLGVYWSSHPDVSYEGREIFTSQEEYSEFKRHVMEALDQGTVMTEMKVLSSEPPIIVEFDLGIHGQDYEFPYGERGLLSFWFLAFFVFLGGMVPLAAAAPIIPAVWNPK